MSDKDISIEELLEMAETEPEKEIAPKKALSEAHMFVLANDIKESDTEKVRAAAIYELYCHWKKNKNLQSYTKFFTDFGKLFKRKQGANYVYYFVDPEPFDLSEEAYWRERSRLRKTTKNAKTNKEKTHKKAEG